MPCPPKPLAQAGDAYGQAVWSCPLDAGVKFAGDPQATEANKPETPGRARSSRSNHRAGNAGVISAYLW